MKKLLVVVILCVSVLSMSSVAYADSDVADAQYGYEVIGDLQDVVAADDVISIENLSSGDRIITTMVEANDASILAAASSTKTGSKTSYYQNSAGVTQWYVRVTGSFTYNGSTATCTSASVSAVSNTSSWVISSSSASKSGATATGKGTGKLYAGILVLQTITNTVKLTCSSGGTLS
jgi:hypothetical protein